MIHRLLIGLVNETISFRLFASFDSIKTRSTMPLRPLKQCTQCVLVGSGERIVLDIAPTMRYLTHGGKKYFRCQNTRQIVDGSEQAMYLWDGWETRFIRRYTGSPQDLNKSGRRDQ